MTSRTVGTPSFRNKSWWEMPTATPKKLTFGSRKKSTSGKKKKKKSPSPKRKRGKNLLRELNAVRNSR